MPFFVFKQEPRAEEMRACPPRLPVVIDLWTQKSSGWIGEGAARPTDSCRSQLASICRDPLVEAEKRCL
jgi:hypothetical protein